MYCPTCGKPIDNGTARFCSGCGQSLQFSMPPGQALTGFFRPREGRMIAGVCAGVSIHYAWDVTVVRLLLALITLFGCGTPILLYLVAWVVMPNAPFALPPMATANPNTTGATAQ